ncbi:hypothetical protein [Streptomyces mirabilis]
MVFARFLLPQIFFYGPAQISAARLRPHSAKAASLSACHVAWL